jgi:hypothetical protein
MAVGGGASGDCPRDDCGCPPLPRSAGVAGRSAFEQFGRELFADLAWLISDERPEASAWAAGAVGEQYVAEHLERLDQRWYITHDVVLGRGRANLDHVVVGPPGVVVVNAKYHGERLVHLDGQVHVDGQRRRHVQQAADEARQVSERLTAATRRPVTASALVAIVSAAFMQTAPSDAKRVAVMPAERVPGFLTRIAGQAPEPRFDPCAVRTLTAAVRSATTWE